MKIISKNPATGQILQELEATEKDDLKEIFAKARAAQSRWAKVSLKERANRLIDLRESILNHRQEIEDLIVAENGKPPFEALTNDIVPSLDLITYFAKKAPSLLKDQKIPLANPVLAYRKSTIQHWPVGVVAVISPWNFPFFLPLAEIIMALVAGNAVVFKPSEVTPLIGLKIQELCGESGFPPHLIQTVIGDGALGAAVIDQRPNKIFFTGSTLTGKKIMEHASKYLIPVVLELGGKDPMIILPDANIDYATSAAIWGGFANSGQVCASTERLYVHKSMAPQFLELLKEKISHLRQGPPSEEGKDIGAITYEKQKEIYKQQLDDALKKGNTLLTGGKFSSDQRFLEPTVVTGDQIEQSEVYKEESFGPIIALKTYDTVSDAIRLANRNKYGLAASVITSNLASGEDVARQLHAGTVNINEVAYTAGLPEPPWGGLKDSGFGKKHSDLGLLEFVNLRHIHKPRLSFFTFKSLWWYPYSEYQYDAFSRFTEMYSKSWRKKLLALPLVLFNLVQMIKREKRL